MSKLKTLKDNLYVELFREFFKLGLFTIGGGIAMLPLLQKVVVEKKAWLTEEEAVDCITISQSLPGVVAINMATYIGRQKKGLPGALCATAGVILPSFLIIILVIELLSGFGNNAYLDGALTGIKAAATGLILWAAYKLGRKILIGWFPVMLAAVSFLAVVFADIHAIWLILVGVIAGICYHGNRENGRSGGDEP